MPDELHADLTDAERELLMRGLLEWGGPAAPTNEIANLIGFADVRTLYHEGGVIARRIRAGDSLAPRDWRRALLATEIAFASDPVGSGVEWPTTTGIPDGESIRLLRSVQRRLGRIIRSA
jgi:hypothetical protein